MSVRKGAFPTDGILKKNLKISNKSLQKLGQKTQYLVEQKPLYVHMNIIVYSEPLSVHTYTSMFFYLYTYILNTLT